MAKQLNVNLAFNADTSSAIKNLNELNATLSKIGSIDIKSNSLSAEMKQAAASAQELQTHLSRAYDSKLGNLNLGKFEQSLKSSNTSLAKLSTDLLGAGRNGEQAFLKLQSSIASANTQLVQSKGLLAEFATALKNTARWQLSSSVLHGFMGAIQSAYGYSQRLNESLNNIRIVTGYNVERMAEFANQANKAAKALSTTTTDYTNASLIYYQQGLSDSEVQARTDVTVKMANVANKTASEVSEQMTAVWNNFYDGSKSLEYYADVMTALGAATASSTDEIAGGLEKFAAIGQTIGLSYEYAAAALATITSNTRQSEEVVGTALKTIFARIQGLNLGETLDDGTTLNKYSQALQKVGISIFDAAGNLKDMDNILDEMGNKWDNLNKAQQVALAQTVAGTRQYTQLVALMDNWNKGDADSFQTNLNTAYNAEGALAEQHAIYEQGWEAAQKRVKAGWEAIYKELVPDEAFIKLYDGFADILSIIEAVVKTAGGLEGIIMLAAGAMMNKFAPAIGEGIQSGIQKLNIFKDKIKNIFTGGDGSVVTAMQGGFAAMKNPIATLKGENTNPYSAAEKSTERIAQNLQVGTTHIQQQVTQSLKVAESWAGVTAGFQQQIKMQQEMNSLTNVVAGNTKNLSKATQERLMHEIQTTEELGIQAAELTQQVEDTRELISSNVNSALTEESLRGSITAAAKHPAGDPNTVIQTASLALPQNLSEDAQLYMQSLLGAEASIENIGEGLTALMIPSQNVKASIQDFGVAADMALSDISELSSLMQILDQINIDDNFGSADQKARAMADAINAAKNLSDPLKKNLLDMVGSYSQMSKSDFTKGLQKQLKTVQSAAKAYKVQEEHIGNAVKLGSQLGTVTQKNTQVTNQYNRALQNVKDNINNALKASLKLGPTLAKGFSSLSSVGMSVNMISNAFDTLTDSSASWTQKLSSGLMALSMSFQAVATVSGMFKSSMAAISGIIATQNAQTAMNAIVTAAATKAQGALTGEQAKRTTGIIALIAAQKLEKGATEASVQEWVKEQLVKKMGVSQDEASALAITMVTGAKRLEGGALKGVAPAKAADIVLTEGQTAANWKEVASLAAKNWWLLLIIAALAILVGGIVAVVNADKQRIETNKKNAETAQKTAQAAKEEAEANRELVNTYEEALKTYQETGKGKQDCIDAAIAAGKAYGIENAAVLALSGNYEELNRQLREKQKLEAQQVKDSTSSAINATNIAFTDALREGSGRRLANGAYYGQFGGGMSETDEQAAFDALKMGDYKHIKDAGLFGGIEFQVDNMNDPQQMLEYYEELDRFIKDQQKIANEKGYDLGSSEFYQAALEEYQAGLEYYNQLKQLMNEENTSRMEIASIEAGDTSNINSLKEYENYVDKYLEIYGKSLEADGIKAGSDQYKELMKGAESYLGTLDDLSKFYAESQGFSELFETEDLDESQQKIKDWYDGLSESEQEVFWTLNIDEDASLNEVQEAMKGIQDWIDSNNYKATIEVTSGLDELLQKERKTDEDWKLIEEKYNALEGDKMDWLDFMRLSQEEQIAYIRNIENHAGESMYRSTQKTIDQLEGTLKTQKEELYAAQGELNTANANANSAEAQAMAEQNENWENEYGYLSEDNAVDTFMYDGLIKRGDITDGHGNVLTYDDFVNNPDLYSQYALDLSNKANNLTGSEVGQMLLDSGVLGQQATALIKNFQSGDMSDAAFGDLYNQLLELYGFAPDSQEAKNLLPNLENLFSRGASNIHGIDLNGDILNPFYVGESGLRTKSYKETYVDPVTQAEKKVGEKEQAVAGTEADLAVAYQNEQYNEDWWQAQVEKHDIDLSEYEEYKKLLAETNKELKDNPNLLNEVALAHKRYEKGVTKIAEKQKEWNKAIKSGDMSEISKILPELNDAVSDMLNLDDNAFDKLSPDFAVENWDLITKAMNGSTEAYEELQTKAASEILLGAKFDEDRLSDSEQAILDSIAKLQAEDVAIGTHFDNSAAAQDLFDLMMMQGKTVDQMQDAFEGLGWNPDLGYEEMTVDEAVKTGSYTSKTVWVPDGMGWKQVTLTDSGINGIDGSTIIRVPKIGSEFKKIGGGNGGGYKPTPSNKGGGGGGSKQHAEKKSTSDRTRYHTLENQLEDLSASYEKVSEAADRAFGKDKLKLIDEEIAATDDLIEKQEEYIDAISENLPKDKAIMTGYYDDFIGGSAMQFDENGNISNYDDIEAAMHAKYNEMADKYTSDSEEWQTFEKKYEQMEKYIEQYEETYDLLRDEEQEYQDLINQRMDLELTKIQYKAELSLNIEDDEIAVIEHQLDMIGDNAFKAAEAIELQIEKAESVYDKIQVNQSALNDILGQQLSQKEIELFYSGDMSVLEGKSFTDNQIQAIKEYRDSFLDMNAEMMEIRDNIQEQVMVTFDAWNEKLERGTAALEHYGSVLESYKNIIDVVGKDALGLSDEFMSNLGQAQVSNAIDKVNASRDVYESMVNAQREAEQALEQARANGDTESIKYWEDTLASITENAQAAQEELLGSWEAALSAIADQFETTVQTLIDNFNDSVYSLGGLEGLSEDFSRQKENADMMLDDYQKIYELSKLSRDINGKLDDTKIIAGKQKLKDLLEKINDLQEDGVEMSQYDLEYLQKEYDLRLAEIELEEAQRAKNTVRMSRDNEGNWSYVYTQNTDAVDSAQQKYEDALYAMQDLSSNYIDEMSEQLIATSQEMQEALAAIRIEDYASIDEYYAEVERVQKQYQDELAMQEAELNKAIGNNKTLYEEDWTNYHNATGYKISDTQEFATTFKDTMLGTLMGSEEDTSNFTSIIGSAVSSLTTGLMEAAQVYYTNLNTAMEAAGTSTDNFAEDTAANIDAVVEKSKEGAAAVDQMAKEMDEAFSAITDKVTAWQETYGLAMQEIIDSNLAVVESFNSMLEALSIDAGKITVNYDINTTPDGVDPAAFDTGGYTGKWGDAGKLAVLHEKELILNQDDTEKFMKAMAYSKMILDTIDLNAKYASMGMGEIVPTLIKEEAPQTLEQMVHITAEFPGVNDHYEIEEAFNNLINKASQYANRKL